MGRNVRLTLFRTQCNNVCVCVLFACMPFLSSPPPPSFSLHLVAVAVVISSKLYNRKIANHTKPLCTIIEMTFAAKTTCSFRIYICLCVRKCVRECLCVSVCCCYFPLKSVLQVKSLSGIIDELFFCVHFFFFFYFVSFHSFYLCVIVYSMPI